MQAVTDRSRRYLLRIIGVLGAGLFLSFFALTFATPEAIEHYGREFIESEARKTAEQAIADYTPQAGDSAVGRLAKSMYEKNQARIDELKTQLSARLYERFADAIAQIRDLDCECRAKWAQHYREGLEARLDLLQSANDRITDFIHAGYMRVVSELKRDIRIFTATNATVFLLLLLVSFLKPQAAAHLFLPGLMLVAATALSSYFYLFGQNWLLTIIYSDYVGFGYLVYLGIAFAFILDVAFNRGRVTTELLNAFFNMIGSAISLVPC